MMRPRLFLLSLLAVAVAAAWWVATVMEGRHTDGEAARQTRRQERLATFASEDVPGDAVVFLGSSTMEFWPLKQSFPDATTVNRGIGAEPIAELMERLESSLAPGASGVVLYAGSVDFNTHGRSTDQVARETAQLLDRIRALRPGLPVVLLGVNPARDTSPDRVRELARLNQLNQARCRRADPPMAFVLTDDEPFRAPSGALSERISRDRWHLNQRGYAELAERLITAAAAVGIKLRP